VIVEKRWSEREGGVDALVVVVADDTVLVGVGNRHAEGSEYRIDFAGDGEVLFRAEGGAENLVLPVGVGGAVDCVGGYAGNSGYNLTEFVGCEHVESLCAL
jgi:hypothetical protein